MTDLIATIYTEVDETFSSLIAASGISKEYLVRLNPHISEMTELEAGIPLDVPAEFKRDRNRSRSAGRGRTSPYQVARSELLKGIAEIPGQQTNPRIREYHASTVGGAEPDEVSWCSSFVNFCVEQASMRGTDSKAARSWHNTGWGVSVPRDQWQEGDIIVFYRGERTGWQGHVGFLVDWTGAKPEVLGGNQGDRISIARPYEFSRILSVRRAN